MYLLLWVHNMSLKIINGKFYGYNEELGEYFDWHTKKPVKISDKKQKPPDIGPDKEQENKDGSVGTD